MPQCQGVPGRLLGPGWLTGLSVQEAWAARCEGCAAAAEACAALPLHPPLLGSWRCAGLPLGRGKGASRSQHASHTSLAAD